MLRRVIIRSSVSPNAELLEFAVRLIRCYLPAWQGHSAPRSSSGSISSSLSYRNELLRQLQRADTAGLTFAGLAAIAAFGELLRLFFGRSTIIGLKFVSPANRHI
jgi:hypothetical protein